MSVGDQKNVVVLYGPPLAGKHEILQWLAREWNARIERFRAREETHQGDRDLGVSLSHPRLPLIVKTVPGCPWFPSTWTDLLSIANALVVVLDPRKERHEIDRQFLGVALALMSSTPCALVVSKKDLVPEPESLSGMVDMLGRASARSWPRFHIGPRRWSRGPKGSELESDSTLVRPIEQWIMSVVG